MEVPTSCLIPRFQQPENLPHHLRVAGGGPAKRQVEAERRGEKVKACEGSEFLVVKHAPMRAGVRR